MSNAVASQHWREGKLEDLVFFQRGFDITQAEQRHGPYPVISSSGVTSCHDEFKVNGPGIVIGRKGTLGSIHSRRKIIGHTTPRSGAKTFEGIIHGSSITFYTRSISNALMLAIPIQH